MMGGVLGERTRKERVVVSTGLVVFVSMQVVCVCVCVCEIDRLTVGMVWCGIRSKALIDRSITLFGNLFYLNLKILITLDAL